MSFILEALRKSESERQRLGTAAIADLPIGRPRRGQPWWVFALSALLLVNLVVLVVVLLRDKPASSTPIQVTPSTTANSIATTTQSTPAPTSAPHAAAPAPNSPALPTSASSAMDNTSAARELQETAAGAPHVEYETVPRTELEIANAAASVPYGPTLVRPLQSQPATAALPAKDVAAPPDLHVDLHVYSKNPHDRFVLINMHRYSEGQQLPNGATVEQINSDDVVLYQNGTRYRLERQ